MFVLLSIFPSSANNTRRDPIPEFHQRAQNKIHKLRINKTTRCEAKNEKHRQLTNPPPPTNREWKLLLLLLLPASSVSAASEVKFIPLRIRHPIHPSIYSSSSPTSSSTFTFDYGSWSSSVRLSTIAASCHPQQQQHPPLFYFFFLFFLSVVVVVHSPPVEFPLVVLLQRSLSSSSCSYLNAILVPFLFFSSRPLCVQR